MMTLQKLLTALEHLYNRGNKFLILFIVLNGQGFSLHFGNNELRTSKSKDIIRQAFPFYPDILDTDVSIESISHSQIKTTFIAKINVECSEQIPNTFFKMIMNGSESNASNEWNAYNMASILFTYFHSNQIEEFNSTWENMYTNWKRFGVKKI